MIIFFDSSQPTVTLRLLDDLFDMVDSWEAGRELSTDIFTYFEAQFAKQEKSWEDITGIVLFQGPGSFTGLRIGHTVLNTVAHTQSIPIVGVQGEQWQDEGLERLRAGEDDRLVMPFYGRDANITTPRK